MDINFVTSHASQSCVDYVARTLREHLSKGERVLWLLAGGSALTVAVDVARTLQGVDASRCVVTLTDERYGPVGHADSNWHQLEQAGFRLAKAKLVPVLSGQSIEQTTRAWSGKLSTLLDQSDFVLGLFGIGPDGHTSGILPNSPAVDAGGLVVHYDGGQYLRITTTPSFIAKLDEAVVYAVGKSKWPTLERLSRSVPTSEQPAQVLKRVPKLTVFTDYDEHANGK